MQSRFSVVVMLLLSGCGHTLYFTDRQTGDTAQTIVKTVPGHPSGQIAMNINGKAYNGRWLYMSGAGSVSIGSAVAYSGVRSASAYGSAFAMPMQGNGSIVMSARDGTTLSCGFDYSEWSNSGLGLCQDSHGGAYDLQIGR